MYNSNKSEEILRMPQMYAFDKLKLNRNPISQPFKDMMDSVNKYQKRDIYSIDHFHYLMFYDAGNEIIAYSQDYSLDLIMKSKDIKVYGIVEYDKSENMYFIVCHSNKENEIKLIKQLFRKEGKFVFKRKHKEVPNNVYIQYYDNPYGFIIKTNENGQTENYYMYGVDRK